MPDILLTEQFRKDLDDLSTEIRRRVPKTVNQIRDNPRHPGLRTHRQRGITGRAIYRSRVNQKVRLLWEWIDDGRIGLWRVGNHEFIDAFDTLPHTSATGWRAPVRESVQHPSRRKETLPRPEHIAHKTALRATDEPGIPATPETPDPLDENVSPAPAPEAAPVEQPKEVDWSTRDRLFKHFRDVHLRILGVPDAQIAAVRDLRNPERIWDLAVPENVRYTLYDIVCHAHDPTEALLRPQRFLYGATADELKDYCTGKMHDLLLNLTPEQERLVPIKSKRPLLIKGVAGSGKTTVGIYRARHIARDLLNRHRLLGEETSVLVLTYTSTLAKAIEELLAHIASDALDCIEVSTCARWMLRQLAHARGAECEMAKENDSKDKCVEALSEMRSPYPDHTFVGTHGEQFFLLEFDDVIRARGIRNLRDYKRVDRVGQKTGLDRERHRPLVWELYERYQRKLDEAGLVDWKDLPNKVFQECDSLPRYDAVIVDEAQDLPPSCLRIVATLVSPQSEYGLTLLADPAQSIYYRGISWKEAGVRLSGSNSRALEHNFRSTVEILTAAKSILEGCEDLKKQDEYLPPESAGRHGPRPIIVQYGTLTEAEDFVVTTIANLCQSGGYRPGDMAVLAKTNAQAINLARRLHRETIPAAYFKAKDEFSVLENKVKMITMHSAKGLEFPVVFLVDLADGVIPYIPKQGIMPSEDQDRKLFYVSMTRAAERLYMLCPRGKPSRFLSEIPDDAVTTMDASQAVGDGL